MHYDPMPLPPLFLAKGIHGVYSLSVSTMQVGAGEQSILAALAVGEQTIMVGAALNTAGRHSDLVTHNNCFQYSLPVATCTTLADKA
jgi:hypothetical protein